MHATIKIKDNNRALLHLFDKQHKINTVVLLTNKIPWKHTFIINYVALKLLRLQDFFYAYIHVVHIVMYNLPGHGFELHDFELFRFPTHVWPPFAGTGLLHALERPWLPDPHVAEHGVHLDHLFQPPFTGNSTIDWDYSSAVFEIAMYWNYHLNYSFSWC